MAGGNPRERTALVVTVLDEAHTIGALLESIEQQTRLPDEVVIVDGGSRDGTWQALQGWSGRLPLRLLQAPGAGIARGRNLAIAATDCELIAVTDAGVRLERDWLARLLAQCPPGIDVVSGFFRADPHTVFERAMGATVLPSVEDIDPHTFLPSSRSVLFRRTAWQAVRGYPEWLDYCEDLVFDLALRDAGCRFVLAAGAIAWFRPRGSLREFFHQYYRYARGDGKADLWRRRHLLRYLVYGATLGLLWRSGPRALLPLAIGGWVNTRRPYARLALRGMTPREQAVAMLMVPVIRLAGDVAKMLGYPVGVCWRLGVRPKSHAAES